MFADQAKIIIRSGKGGNGHVSFRREKYVPNGGPDGGDGGKGGDIIFEVDSRVNHLSDFRHRRKFAAQSGEEGGKSRRHGKSGEDLVLKVPAGTIIRDAEQGRVIADLSGDNTRVVVLKGGRGGLGNQHFATSRMQAPRYAQPGGEAVEIEVLLELKTLADVGLIGFPNVGKSTLLSRLTNARPKVANYHFTTLNPVLGVVDLPDGEGFVVADIPGLIEGAAEGAGLGHDFLRHIERTKVLVHLVDGASTEGRDPIEDIQAIDAELASFSKTLLDKPQILVCNKLDALADQGSEILETVRQAFPERKVFGISAVSGQGVEELLYEIAEMVKSQDSGIITFDAEFDPMEEAVIQESLVNVEKAGEGTFLVYGPKIDKMLGYTNLESEKGYAFFQKYLKEQGIERQLIDLGIQDGDTVQIYEMAFEYYA
ncbi:MAG: GTPase ObgE [Lachnospiraceae bacterium]|nr:GTPase ObgE [Lachnospiraceae bacterium]